MAYSFCPKCVPHEFQDRQFGLNIRLVNQTTKGNGTIYRCTVCGSENPIQQKPKDWIPSKK